MKGLDVRHQVYGAGITALRALRRTLAASALLVVAACRESSTEPVDATYPTFTGGIAAARQDAMTVKSATISGDVLVMQVEYGGGCEDHQFALRFDGTFRESNPVQTGAIVAHDAKGDPCRALVRETLTFDLTLIKRAWQRAYNQVAGEMMLGVSYRTYDGLEAVQLRYTFRQ